MKPFIPLLFIILTINCYFPLVSGQDLSKTQASNVIYASAGTLGGWFTAGANYERQLFSTDNKLYVNYYLRACIGALATWGAEGPYGTLSLQGTFGEKKSHLEIGLGMGAFFNKGSYETGLSNSYSSNPSYEAELSRWDYTDFIPAISAGYRFQKPDGGLVLRTGIGFPERIYISIGLAL